MDTHETSKTVLVVDDEVHIVNVVALKFRGAAGDLLILGAAKVETVGQPDRLGADTSQIASRLGDRLCATHPRIEPNTDNKIRKENTIVAKCWPEFEDRMRNLPFGSKSITSRSEGKMSGVRRGGLMLPLRCESSSKNS